MIRKGKLPTEKGKRTNEVETKGEAPSVKLLTKEVRGFTKVFPSFFGLIDMAAL